jgi:hypothetical protein
MLSMPKYHIVQSRLPLKDGYKSPGSPSDPFRKHGQHQITLLKQLHPPNAWLETDLDAFSNTPI